MRKIIILIVAVLLFTLTGCIEQSADKLIIKLNPGVDTIQVGDIFVDSGANAHYVFKTLTPEVTYSDVNQNEIGVYTITYEISYLDYTKTISRIVTVVDEKPPVLTLNPGVDTIIKGQEWIDAGINAEDNTNHEITIDVTGEVDITQAGEYVITYLASDENGNTSSIVRYVTVLEVE